VTATEIVVFYFDYCHRHQNPEISTCQKPAGARQKTSPPGIPILLLGIAVVALTAAIVISMIIAGFEAVVILVILVGIELATLIFTGLYSVEPNQTAVLSLFGKYVGTVHKQGLRFNNLFFTVSLPGSILYSNARIDSKKHASIFLHSEHD